MLKRLSGVRNRGSKAANPAISTIRKISGANRARKPNTSGRVRGWAPEGECSVNVSMISFSVFRSQSHHRHPNLLRGVFAFNLTCDPAFSHRNDAVADRQNLG